MKRVAHGAAARSGRLALAASAALLCSLASAQLLEPRTANERALVDAVAQRLSSCFASLGPTRDFPVAAAAPPHKELLAAVVLKASGPLVGDGYSYMLLVHGPSNAAYVVQHGGFAAQRTVYGPLPLDTRCSDSPARPASQASGAARPGR
jgi:hypothetical protein